MYDTLVTPGFRFAAKMVQDVEGQRKAQKNKIEVMTRPLDKADTDGICRGYGYVPTNPFVISANEYLDNIVKSEKAVKSSFVSEFKQSPFVKIAEDNFGIGLPMLALLLGYIGDPYIKPAKIDVVTGELLEPERIRTLSELFAYCGMIPSARKKKGASCNYSLAAQSTLWNMAEAIKHITPAKEAPLKTLWTQWKDYYSTKVDDNGKPWNGIHAMAAAHRKVGREILIQLYTLAEQLHTSE